MASEDMIDRSTKWMMNFDNYCLPFIVISLMIFGISTGMNRPMVSPPVISNITIPGGNANLYQKYEIQFDLSTTFTNPFDPAQIDIQGIYIAPNNNISTTNAFWYQPFTISSGVNSDEAYTSAGSARWALRFSPITTGNYSCQIMVNSIYGTSSSTTLHFTSVNSSTPGFVRIHSSNHKYFQFDNGTMFFPIGQNFSGKSDATHPSLDGVTAMRYYCYRLASTRANWIRYWMTNLFGNAIEWTGSGYSGLGKYNLSRAYRVDKDLESAQSNSIYVQFTLLDFRQVSNWADIYWPQSPYNSLNGGPIPNNSPQSFFSNTSAKNLYKQQLRYVVSRWGYLPNIFAWELFNEVEYTCDTNQNVFSNSTIKNDVINWHQEMASYLKSIDPNQHMVTTSSDDPWYPNAGYLNYGFFSSLWALPQMDIIQTHIYTYTIESDIIRATQYFHNTFNKPNLCAEYGIQSLPEYDNTTIYKGTGSGFNPTTYIGTTTQRDHLIQGTHVHNALWTAMLNESLSGMWWWACYMESDTTMHRNSPQFPLYYHYTPVDRFMKVTLDPTKYPYEDWANYGLSSAIFTASPSLRVCGLSSKDRAYFWYRDTANDYFSNLEPGDIANRTVSNSTITIYGMDTNVLYVAQYFDTYGIGGPFGSKFNIQSSNSGTLIIALTNFKRDRALKIGKLAQMTSLKDGWQDYSKGRSPAQFISRSSNPK